MTTTADATTASQDAAFARINSAIDALLALRGLAAELPDIADRIIIGEHGSARILIYVGHGDYAPGPVPPVAEVAARIARIAEAAERHGATLAAKSDHKYGGVTAMFGPFEMWIYAPVEQVSTAAVRKVTEWQMDERLAAFGTAVTT